MIKSISELKAMGYPEDMLRKISHMPANPFFRMHPNGKFFCDEDRLKEFIEKHKTD